MLKKKILFATTGERCSDAGFNAKYARHSWQHLDLEWIVKWRDTVPQKEPDERGSKIAWTPKATIEQMDKAFTTLAATGILTWLYCENIFDEDNAWLLERHPAVGVILGGSALERDRFEEYLTWHEKKHQTRPAMLAIETPEVFGWAGHYIKNTHVYGMIGGSSFLSEYSKMYDMWGLVHFRRVLHALAKSLTRNGKMIYGSGNYCTFDPEGRGDRSRKFVEEQILYIINQPCVWGMITRFYRHADYVEQIVSDVESGKIVLSNHLNNGEIS